MAEDPFRSQHMHGAHALQDPPKHGCTSMSSIIVNMSAIIAIAGACQEQLPAERSHAGLVPHCRIAPRPNR